MLDRNADGSVNFGTRLIAGTGPHEAVNRSDLKEAIRELFSDDAEVSLLYFAGHGYIETTGGYLCASDSRSGDDGVPLSEIMMLANRSAAARPPRRPTPASLSGTRAATRSPTSISRRSRGGARRGIY